MDGLQRLKEEMLFLKLEQGVLVDLLKSAPPGEREAALKLFEDVKKKLNLVNCAIRRASQQASTGSPSFGKGETDGADGPSKRQPD